MIYKYTLINQDGTTSNIGEYKSELPFKSTSKRTGLYEILDCSMVELIPRSYYPDADGDNVIYWGDEEARFNSDNKTNRHMKVLIDARGNKWDIVGNLVKEEKISETKNNKGHKDE